MLAAFLDLLPEFRNSTVQISIVNALLSWAAGMAHIYGAINTSGWLRRMFVAIASLALFYSLAYWWLVWNPTEGVAWSEFLRPWAIFTWVIAWGIEPLVLVHYLGRRSKALYLRAEEEVQNAQIEGTIRGLQQIQDEEDDDGR